MQQNAEELEYGLIVLWEMLENQAPLLEGHEADIFGVLLQIRYCAQMNVRAVGLGSGLRARRDGAYVFAGDASDQLVPRYTHEPH